MSHSVRERLLSVAFVPIALSGLFVAGALKDSNGTTQRQNLPKVSRITFHDKNPSRDLFKPIDVSPNLRALPEPEGTDAEPLSFWEDADEVVDATLPFAADVLADMPHSYSVTRLHYLNGTKYECVFAMDCDSPDGLAGVALVPPGATWMGIERLGGIDAAMLGLDESQEVVKLSWWLNDEEESDGQTA